MINILKIFQSYWTSKDIDLLKFSDVSLDNIYENLLNNIFDNELNKFSCDILKEKVVKSIEYEKTQKN